MNTSHFQMDWEYLFGCTLGSRLICISKVTIRGKGAISCSGHEANEETRNASHEIGTLNIAIILFKGTRKCCSI